MKQQNKVLTPIGWSTVLQDKKESIVANANKLDRLQIELISALITMFNPEGFKELKVSDIFEMRTTLTNARNCAKQLSDDLGEALYVFDHLDTDAAKHFIDRHERKQNVSAEQS